MQKLQPPAQLVLQQTPSAQKLLAQRMERELKSVVEAFQSAVAEGDKGKLNDANALAKQFRDDADALAALPGESDEGTTLRANFDAYLDAALNASSVMLGTCPRMTCST